MRKLCSVAMLGLSAIALVGCVVRPAPYPHPYGGRCAAHFRTAYGPQKLVCPLAQPQPLHSPCLCPPPEPPPGYPPLPPPKGHTIR